MFQYACGRTLAEKYHTSLVFDLLWFSSESANLPHAVRKLSLDKFKIDYQDISQSELKKFNDYLLLTQTSLSIHNSFRLPDLWFKRLVYSIKYKKYYIVNEQMNFKYTPDLFNNQSDIFYLNGYWQNELYFYEIKELLLQQFTLKIENCSRDRQLINQMKIENSVAIHIRRGDYASSASTQAYHGLLSLEYYKKAIEQIIKNVSDPVFYLFSDDPAWCKDNFDFPFRFYVVSNNTRNDAEELILMSKCKHQIIANSSFSWWAAWLNKFQEKVVITPKIWISNSLDNPCPKEWIRI